MNRLVIATCMFLVVCTNVALAQTIVKLIEREETESG